LVIENPAGEEYCNLYRSSNSLLLAKCNHGRYDGLDM